MRLQRLTVDHVDRYGEQSGDIGLDTDIVENCDVRIRVELDEDVDVGPVVATRNRTEQSGMRHALGA